MNCKKRLSKKISKNIREGKYKTTKQAIAVAYSQMPKSCRFKKFIEGSNSSEKLVLTNKPFSVNKF